MMGVTSLEVYNTIYNITEKNNKLKLFTTEQNLKEYKFATEFIPKIKNLYETSNKGISQRFPYWRFHINFLSLV